MDPQQAAQQAADAQAQQAALAQQAPADLATVVQQLQGMCLQQQQMLAAQQQQTQALAQQMQQFMSSFQAPVQQQAQQQQQPASSQAVQASSSSVAAIGSFKPPKPEMYSGKQPAALPSWLISIQSYLEATGVVLNTPDAVRCAASYLKDKALEWYHLQFQTQGNTIPFQSFADFRQALQHYILPVDPSFSARDKLDRFRQIGSAYQYTTEFNAIMLNLPNMSEEDRVHCYIRGLKQQVHMQVAVQRPTTLAAAQQLAITVDTAVYKGNRQGPQGYRSTPASSSSAPSGPTPMELGAHNANESELSAFPCHNCGQEGHYARDCTAPPRSNNRGRGRGRGNRGRGGRGRGRSSTHHAPPN